jgi:hypothetical protein
VGLARVAVAGRQAATAAGQGGVLVDGKCAWEAERVVRPAEAIAPRTA